MKQNKAEVKHRFRGGIVQATFTSHFPGSFNQIRALFKLIHIFNKNQLGGVVFIEKLSPNCFIRSGYSQFE